MPSVSPIFLSTFLEVYSTPVSVKPPAVATHRRSPAKLDILEELLNLELIEASGSVYRLTKRGEKYRTMVLSTPFPEQKFVDPREFSDVS